MPRFFKEFFESQPFIDGDDAKHILRSLRMTVGEKLTVCDTKGFDYSCVISACSDSRVELEIKEKHKNDTEPTIFVTLYLCLTKGDKMDLAVRQAVQELEFLAQGAAAKAEKDTKLWQTLGFIGGACLTILLL